MKEVHDLIDAIIQTAAHEGWEDREVYSLDIIRMQNELREKYAALQQQLAAAREELHIACGERSLAREALQEAEADAARWRWYRDECFICLDEYDSDEKQANADAAIATLQRDRQP